jgi:hypothetical protein
MSLQQLQTTLQSQVTTTGSCSVSAATLQTAGLTPCDGFDVIIQSYLVLTGPLQVVTTSVPAPNNNTLNFSGTTSILGLTSISVQVTFILEATSNTVDVTIAATPTEPWSFSTSFPQLDTFPFSALTLTQPIFLLTTVDGESTYTWNSVTVTLHKGLNMASLLQMNGPFAFLQALMSSLAPTESFLLSGSIDPTAQPNLDLCMPALSLKAKLPTPITGDTHFTLSNPEIKIVSEPDEGELMYYWAVIGTDLTIPGASSPFCKFESSILQDCSVITLIMSSSKGITPAQMIELLGVNFNDYMLPPAITGVFSAVTLEGLSATIDLSTMTVLALDGSIGLNTATPWQLGTLGTIESMTLNCSTQMPFAAGASGTPVTLVNFNAGIALFPNADPPIFIGKDGHAGIFEFDITNDESGLVISASYKGTVDINNLVAGLSGGKIVVPKNFVSLSFEDFGIGIAQQSGNYSYVLYGTSKAEFNIPMLGSNISVDLEFNVASADSLYQLVGGLTIGNSYFEAAITLSSGTTTLSGSWSALYGEYLNLQNILTALNLQVPSIPSALDLNLESAALSYEVDPDDNETFVIRATSKTYGKAVFVSLPIDGTQEYFFLLQIDQSYSLSNLPLIGSDLANIANIEIGNFQIVISSIPASTSQIVSTVNDVIGSDYPNLPLTGTTGVVVLAAEISFGATDVPVIVSLGSANADRELTEKISDHNRALEDPSVVVMGSSSSLSSVQNNGSWYTLQKSFGPVTFQRIGVMYQSNTQNLWFELDATLALGPLSISLVGMGIGASVSDFTPHFSLQGLGVSFIKPPLSIVGSFVNMMPPSGVEFEGSLLVGTDKFELEAFGFYGNQTGVPSMFVFGDVAASFGGPPALFVTGIALGFGYNSSLRLPTVDQVDNFPFVEVLPNAVTPGQLQPPATPQDALNDLLRPPVPWVKQQQGPMWFAAGITFTSFQIVNSQALVIVETGKDLTISLLGTSKAQFPQGMPPNSPAYAYIALNLQLVIKPSEGKFALEAVLSKASFLLDRSCVLTGGFAFYVWFGDNTHAGDFVLTLGGYNPGFVAPGHYPTVPKLGFHWSLDSSISITGSAYLAFTPSVLMVGAELKAVYQSGKLRAWFDAHADMIVQWKPFWFDATVGVTVGASYKVDLLFTSKTVTVELGCDLKLWGPPTGGSVYVSWYIISFTIPFGTPNNHSKASLSWSDVQAMLPNSGTASMPTILSIAPRGLTAATTQPLPGISTPQAARASQLGFTITSSLPATSVTVGGTYTLFGKSFNVAPLGWKNVTSTLAISIINAGGQDYSSSFTVKPTMQNLPMSLWGSLSSYTPAGNNQLVPNLLVGADVQVNPPQIGGSAGAINVGLSLQAQPLGLTNALMPFSQPPSNPSVPQNGGNTIGTMASTSLGIAATNTIAARNLIFNALAAAGCQPTTKNDTMTLFSNNLSGAFSDEPLMANQ